MDNLTTDQLEQLLEEVTSGPWEYVPGDTPDGRYIGNHDTWGMCIGVEANGEGSSCSDADLELAAHAPEIAQRLIQQSTGIEQLRDVCLSERDKAFNMTPMRAGEVKAFNFVAENLDELLDDNAVTSSASIDTTRLK